MSVALAEESFVESTTPWVSFIIPSLNEERFIASTIRQFQGLNGVIPFEVIVADGQSSDRTVEIAKRLGARTYSDVRSKKTIASGRNLGARFARADLLVFCDADTQIDDLLCFTRAILKAFRDERLTAVIPRLEVIAKQRNLCDRLFSAFFNRFVRTSILVRQPFAGGQCQVIRRSSFIQVGGYNDDQVHGEDSSILRKLIRVGRVLFANDLTILESPRRYRKLGYLKLIAIGVYSAVGQKILGRNVLRSWERVG